jgi:hypothetical protein
MPARQWPATFGVAALALLAVAVGAAFVVLRPSWQGGSGRAATPRLDAGLRTGQPGGALVLSAAAGDDVIALTVSPPRPGSVHLEVRVVGFDNKRAGAATVRGTSRGDAAFVSNLGGCGQGCFVGSTEIPRAGVWNFAVDVAGYSRPLTARMAAPLPASDATSILATTIARMHGLRTVRVHETLSSRVGGPVTRTEFRYAAPNRFAYDVLGESSVVVVGTRRYTRAVGSTTWHIDEWPDSHGFEWPARFYSEFWEPFTAVRMVGTSTLNGAPTRVLTFARTDVAAWFRIWIGDRDGLVHRMEMRAEGHIMNQVYGGMNEPVSITAPAN